MPKTIKRTFGDLGETLACQFLMKRGFKIITRNYLKPWGEIDIVATKNKEYRFIEVKSVSSVINPIKSGESTKNVIHETRKGTQEDQFRPEENVHPHKLKRLYRTIETYLIENNIDGSWQLDVVTVRMDETNKLARIEIIENIVE